MTIRRALLLGTPAVALALALWIVPAAREEAQLKARLAALGEETGDMDAHAATVRSRLAVKYALAGDLVAGRVTLAAAAARFHDLNRDVPEYMDVIRAKFPGRTDEESQARNVVEFALAGVGDPGEQARVRGRLAAEFRTLFPDARPVAEPGTDPPTRAEPRRRRAR